MKIISSPSQNFGPRKDGKAVRYLVLHYTDTLEVTETLALLQGEREASAHYVVDTDGTVYGLVDEEMRAWHAGASCWEGEADVNSASIGIEIQNAGHIHGPVPFPDAQMKAVAELCRGIIGRHNIKPWHVIAHSDIAPLRKKDPGELFPWRALAEAGVGLWPAVTTADRGGRDEAEIGDLLARYGYDTGVDQSVAMTAFQRHFHPESFTVFDICAPYDAETIARLAALVRIKEQDDAE